MIYADLSLMHWIDIPMIAVGWIGPEAPFSHGTVEPAVRQRLQLFDETPWFLLSTLGWHFCELCPAADGMRRDSCNANLYVPSEQGLYLAPKLLAHYIDQHNYVPPAAFCEALLRCPLPGTDEYSAQLKRLMPEEFHSGIDECQDECRARQASSTGR
jgi:hypothetical protein